MMVGIDRRLVPAVDRRLFSVFGQSGVACCSPWFGAGSTSGDVAARRDRKSACSACAGGQDLFEASSVSQEELQESFFRC